MNPIKCILSAAMALLAALLTGCAGNAGASGTASPAENQSLVYGKVTAASGNEITIDVGTPSTSGTVSGAEGSSMGSEPSGDMGGEPPSDMDRGPSSSGSGGGRQSRASLFSLTLTGEERTYRIPVGTPVLLQSGQGSITTNFMQIVVDNTVSLTLQTGADGAETVVSATILGQGGGMA